MDKNKSQLLSPKVKIERASHFCKPNRFFNTIHRFFVNARDLSTNNSGKSIKFIGQGIFFTI